MNGNPDSLPVALPDGTQFQPWRDEIDYRLEYCVDQQHPQTSDQNPGTEAAPFLTIQRAAAIVESGEKVLIKSGIYREWVQPRRGGTIADDYALHTGVSPAEIAALRHALVE